MEYRCRGYLWMAEPSEFGTCRSLPLGERWRWHHRHLDRKHCCRKLPQADCSQVEWLPRCALLPQYFHSHQRALLLRFLCRCKPRLSTEQVISHECHLRPREYDAEQCVCDQLGSL